MLDIKKVVRVEIGGKTYLGVFAKENEFQGVSWSDSDAQENGFRRLLMAENDGTLKTVKFRGDHAVVEHPLTPEENIEIQRLLAIFEHVKATTIPRLQNQLFQQAA